MLGSERLKKMEKLIFLENIFKIFVLFIIVDVKCASLPQNFS